MQHIARLLDIPGQSGPPSPAFVGAGVYSPRTTGRGSRESRPLFHTGRLPEFTAPRRESLTGVVHRTDAERRRKDRESPGRATVLRKEASNGSAKRDASGSRTRSREGSPRMPRPRSEEIPLELIKKSPVPALDAKLAAVLKPQVIRCEVPEPVVSTAPTEVAPSAVPVVASEETSFIARDGVATPKKKGSVETV